jgi:hypothetical protein
MKHIKTLLLLVTLVIGLVGPRAGYANQVEAPDASLGTAFTYQGRLALSGNPASGNYDFRFILYDAEYGGNQVGNLLELFNIIVTDGYFTVKLDFGAVFNGNTRWLEVAVKATGGGTYTILSPRQELTAAPYALYSRSAPWSGLTGVPAGFTDGVDDNTTYSAGTGLTLSGTTFNVDTNVIQQRVNGTCAVGSMISAIHADGTVTCQVDAPLRRAAPPDYNIITKLDSAGIVGWDTSITIGTDGLGLISYRDETNDDLKVAHCNNTACSSATITTLDTGGGSSTSITIGADGLGLISYRDYNYEDLKVAHCSNIACSSATTSILDSAGDVGKYTSITIGADGLGLISYTDDTNYDLKVAHCSNTACSGVPTITTLDTTGDIGFYYTSITIGADGLGLISYFDNTTNDLKVAHCSNIACSSVPTITTLDSADTVGEWISITIGTDGLGLISYSDSSKADLKVAHCSNTVCSSASTYTLDSSGYVGYHTSITIGADGLGLISYYDSGNGDLKMAHCSNIECSAAIFRTYAVPDDVGRYSSITIGTDGLPLIAYYNATTYDLEVGHCSNAFCVNYFRRR